jgi:hypothetical protein
MRAKIGCSGVLIRTGGSVKFSIARAVGTASALVSGVSSAQTGNIMNGGSIWGSGWMGGFGGFWGPILLVAVVGLLVWVVLQRRK